MNGASAYDWLTGHATTSPSAPAVVRWSRDGEPWWTYRQLWMATNGVAEALRRNGIRPGDRVVLALPNEPSFVIALAACMAAGAIAVPAPVPTGTRMSAVWERLRGIVANCAPRLLVTPADQVDRVRTQVSRSGEELAVVAFEALAAEGGQPGYSSDLGGCAVALLQYTSGSTSRPRGVVVTHDMLLSSCAQTAAAYEEGVDDVAVTWVPLFHDMGLVTAVMRPLFTGYRTVLLSPQEFVGAPVTWLRAIHRYGGTLSSAPNFAYDLVVRKTTAEQLRGLDLSRWRVARNAGEPVLPRTLDRFAAHLASTGFAAASACPSYGLAEATLTVTTCGPQVRPARIVVDREALKLGTVVRHDPSDDQPGRELVSSGVPVPGTEVRIGDCDGPMVAEVMIRGPQVTPGYWPDGTGAGDATAGWRATGDLGFLYNGQLFVLGRGDDTLVIYGRNYHMGDVVTVCAGIPGIRAGRVTAFVPGTDPESFGQIVLVAELDRRTAVAPSTLDALASRIRQRLVEDLDLHVSVVEFLAPGALPVTTSGKVRTSEARRRYRAGRLPLVPARPVSQPGPRPASSSAG